MNSTVNNPENTDEEIYDALSRSLAAQGTTTSLDDVVALGRRTRNRHRAVAAGIGTSAAALVAAIGVLAAPSGGSGAATAATAQGAKPPVIAPTSAAVVHQNIDIEDAAFSLHATPDGIVDLQVKEMFDADKLRAALAEAGVPADVQFVKIPDDWNKQTGFRCELPSGITELNATEKAVIPFPKPGVPENWDKGTALRLYTKNLSAGAVVSIDVFGGTTVRITGVSVLSGDPGPCHLTTVPRGKA